MSRLRRRQLSTAPPGHVRLYAMALIALGLGLLTLTTAPLLDVGAQTVTSFRPRDPGVRPGNPGAGGPIDGLTPDQKNFFGEGLARFNEVDSVTGSLHDEEGKGLGPRFNLNSCAGCHAQPAVGGSSPTLGVGVNKANPQVAVAKLDGANNQIPSFITSDGPVREARFVKNPDGTADGGVHDLFTIAGRSDAPADCTIAQPNFGTQLRNNNVVFRIPTPTFGAGLIEAIPDSTLVSNLATDLTSGPTRSSLGITGRLNREGNAGTITRFGWKAQNKSLMIFSGEAYLVEQGVTSEMFTQERGEPTDGGGTARVEPPASCMPMGTPEDLTDFTQANQLNGMNDIQGFSFFMMFTAAPQPAPIASDPSASRGQQLFTQVGCAACHTPQLMTGHSTIHALDSQPVNLYSDLAIHNMGSGLADGVSQGAAGGDEFRTAPLWGVGQRVFFLHDGRTRDLYQAIMAHASNGSEANAVVVRFQNLGTGQQDVLNFLRKL